MMHGQKNIKLFITVTYIASESRCASGKLVSH